MKTVSWVVRRSLWQPSQYPLLSTFEHKVVCEGGMEEGEKGASDRWNPCTGLISTLLKLRLVSLKREKKTNDAIDAMARAARLDGEFRC